MTSSYKQISIPFDELPRTGQSKRHKHKSHSGDSGDGDGEGANSESDSKDRKFNASKLGRHKLNRMSSASCASASGERCPLKSFPWLDDVIKNSLKCLGDIPESSSQVVLDNMDYFICNFVEDYNEYYKCPRLASILSKYVRNFLYMYDELYASYEKDNNYFIRIIRLLAMYADLELCSSTLGLETELDTVGRMQMLINAYLEGAEPYAVFDVLIRMNRLRRGHRNILTLIFRAYLVAEAISEPREVDDDVYVKFLMLYKRWLAVDDIPENQEEIKRLFPLQVKPKKTICSNKKFLPILPNELTYYVMSDKHELLLEMKILLAPLIFALNLHQSKTIGSRLPQQANEILVLDDDETDPTKFTIKTEPISGSAESNLIDLTEDPAEDREPKKRKPPWLLRMIERAKATPPTIEDSDEETGTETNSANSSAVVGNLNESIVHECARLEVGIQQPKEDRNGCSTSDNVITMEVAGDVALSAAETITESQQHSVEPVVQSKPMHDDALGRASVETSVSIGSTPSAELILSSDSMPSIESALPIEPTMSATSPELDMIKEPDTIDAIIECTASAAPVELSASPSADVHAAALIAPVKPANPTAADPIIEPADQLTTVEMTNTIDSDAFTATSEPLDPPAPVAPAKTAESEELQKPAAASTLLKPMPFMSSIESAVELIAPIDSVEPDIFASSKTVATYRLPSLPNIKTKPTPTNETHIQPTEKHSHIDQTPPCLSKPVNSEAITSNKILIELPDSVAAEPRRSQKSAKKINRRARATPSTDPSVVRAQNAPNTDNELDKPNRSTNEAATKALLDNREQLTTISVDPKEPQPQPLNPAQLKSASTVVPVPSIRIHSGRVTKAAPAEQADDEASHRGQPGGGRASKSRKSSRIQEVADTSAVAKPVVQKELTATSARLSGRSSLRLAQKNKGNTPDTMADDEQSSVPATIMERKTYIKSSAAVAASKAPAPNTLSTRYLNKSPIPLEQPVPFVASPPSQRPASPAFSNPLDATVPATVALQLTNPDPHTFSGTDLDIAYRNGIGNLKAPPDAPAVSHTMTTNTVPFCETQCSPAADSSKQTIFTQVAPPNQVVRAETELNYAAVNYSLFGAGEQRQNDCTYLNPYPSLAPTSSTMQTAAMYSGCSGAAPLMASSTVAASSEHFADKHLVLSDTMLDKSDFTFTLRDEHGGAHQRSPPMLGRRQAVIDESDYNSNTQSPDAPSEEIDSECDATLPFKKRRKLASALEGTAGPPQTPSPPNNSQPPTAMGELAFFPADGLDNRFYGIVTTTAPQTTTTTKTTTSTPTLPNPTQMQTPTPIQAPTPSPNPSPKAAAMPLARLSYPSTKMLSIANVMEFLPVRAYQPLKTPAIDSPSMPFNMAHNDLTALHAPAPGIAMPAQNLAVAQMNAMPANPSPPSALGLPPQPDQFMHTMNVPQPQVQLPPGERTPNPFGVAHPNNGYNFYHTYHVPHQPYTTTYGLPASVANSNTPSPNIPNTLNVHNFLESQSTYAPQYVQPNRPILEKSQLLVGNPPDSDSFEATPMRPQQPQQQQQPEVNVRASTRRSQPRSQPTRSQPPRAQPRIQTRSQPQSSGMGSYYIDSNGAVVSKGARKMLVTPEQRPSTSSSAPSKSKSSKS